MGLAERYARVAVRLRWLILAAVGVITWAALSMLPSVAMVGGGLSGVVGADQPAVQAQIDSVRRFGIPLLSGTALVQRDPRGMDQQAIRRAVIRAVELDRRTLENGLRPSGDVFGALPLINSPLLVPAAGERNTTVVTYLFADPSLSASGQVRAAREYAAQVNRPGDALVGVAGTIPTQLAQRAILDRTLPLVELATLAAIAVIVGVSFRSVVAPLITLTTAAIGYLLADRVIGWLAGAADLTVPVEIEPIVVALMLGITTDYSIFFLSGVQRRLRAGQANPMATSAGVGEYLGIVLVAGVTVAAGVAALAVAKSGLFRAFGPGLAVTVLVGLAVAVVLVPAMVAVLGRGAFWPYGLSPSKSARAGHAVQLEPGDPAPPGPVDVSAPAQASLLIRLLRHRWVSALVAVAVVGALVLAGRPLFELRGAVLPVDSLPAANPARAATEAAAAGFTPGILSPTGLIVSAPGIASRPAALAALLHELRRQPGVDMVFGPGEQPLLGQPPPDQLLPEQVGLFLAPGGGAARFLVVFSSDPLGASAVGHLRELREEMPRLLATAGLTDAQASYTGVTSIGLSLLDQARADLIRVAVAVGLVNLLLLALFLRALIAPLYLLASTALAMGAALGLTVTLFQDVLGHDGLVFYVVFAAAVLLVSLGSDYTIFSVGYVWDAARNRSLPDALAIAVPRATRAITVAGLTLAASFALVALIPLVPFRELAFIMALGVLIDALIVRSLLVPALISLVGRASGWPGSRLARQRTASPSAKR